MKAQDIDIRSLLTFQPERGQLLLGHERMLLLSQRALGHLAEILGSHQGRDYTQALFAQFGYRCGQSDYAALNSLAEWDSDIDRLSSGPVMHMWEGLVHVEPTLVDVDREQGRFRMTGIWRQSFEAENWQRNFGMSSVPVCASLTGYVSGWGSAFFGRPLLAIETQCIAKGDPYCAFEVRPESEWGSEADPWRRALGATVGDISRLLDSTATSSMKALTDLRQAVDEHALVTISDSRGRITYANSRFCQVTGYTPTELLGRDHRVLNSGHHSKAFIRTLWETVLAGRVWRGEMCNRTKDGTRFWVETAIVPVLDVNGHPEQFIALRTDISARKAAEAALQVAKDAADSAAMAKGEFLATMSHEIRTPMNGVLGLASLLMETPLSQEQRLMVETLQRSATGLLGILNDVLDYSKSESGRMEIAIAPLQLGDPLREAIDIVTPRVQEKGLTLALQAPADSPCWVAGDAGRIRQVLVNLLGNAVKFTEAGQVTVTVEMLDGAVRTAVRDTGIGIDPGARARLFTRFEQGDASTTRRFGGTGLGLAISKQLIELMGGQIGVDSEPGAGSTFWFTLPTATPSATAAATDPATATNPATDTDTVRVLIAEDNATNQFVLTRFLAKLHCTFDIAADGAEAVERWLHGAYDLVLMDCHMPNVDGFTAARQIRTHERARAGDGGEASHVRIVACSASVLESERRACTDAGMDGFLAKPVDRILLAACVAEVRAARRAATAVPAVA